ncbi:MAG: hypothetical protein ACM3ML_31510 [Micromonosporaceae bacterium]
MHGLTTAVAASGWSLSGSIMTFAIPVGLFVVVATTLFFIYSRPPVAPGHSDVVPSRLTPAPHRPAAGAGQPAEGQGTSEAQATGSENTETPSTGTQTAEDAE